MDLDLWKKRKKELHWTHDDLARESGVSRRTIARIFAGKPNTPSPTLNTIEAIERALGINEKSPTAQDAQPGYVDEFVRDFGDLFADEDFIKYAKLCKKAEGDPRLFLFVPHRPAAFVFRMIGSRLRLRDRLQGGRLFGLRVFFYHGLLFCRLSLTGGLSLRCKRILPLLGELAYLKTEAVAPL